MLVNVARLPDAWLSKCTTPAWREVFFRWGDKLIKVYILRWSLHNCPITTSNAFAAQSMPVHHLTWSTFSTDNVRRQ